MQSIDKEFIQERNCCSHTQNYQEAALHGHHHEHSHTGELRRKLWTIGLTTVLLAVAIIIEHVFQGLDTWQLLLIYLVPYLLAGHATLHEAVESIGHGDWFNEDFLMSVATLGALSIGFLPEAESEFAEAVFVMLFFQVGEAFESYAEEKSRTSISLLMNIRPDVAYVERNERVIGVHPEHVTVGETIVVRPGERVPLDGIIVEGATSLNTIALTGESMPRDVAKGDEAISGCVNLSGVIRMKVTKSYGESTVSKIINLVENAGSKKSKSETFITRFARVYTPVVVFSAIALAFLPPLFSGTFMTDFPVWLHKALIFLVVSCPCALVISVPLTFFGGIGGASRKGILIKGGSYMDTLAKVSTVVFDKTGTLTHGQFAVEAVHPELSDKHRLLHLAAHAECFSTHPIGTILRDAFPEAEHDGCRTDDVEEIAGQGIRARIEGSIVCVGNSTMMDTIGVKWHDCHHAGTIVHVAIDGDYAGHIVITDKIKEDSATAIKELKGLGIARTVMLTGDKKEVGERVAQELGLDEWHTELLPHQKVEEVERLLATKEKSNFLAFVGDGINDAPVLARADIGIAMGGMGSDAAIEAADVVLMDDKPSKIATAIQTARRTLSIARQNVVFAIGVKTAVLILATFGLSTMWMAVFADVGVTVIAVLNAMRTLQTKHASEEN